MVGMLTGNQNGILNKRFRGTQRMNKKATEEIRNTLEAHEKAHGPLEASELLAAMIHATTIRKEIQKSVSKHTIKTGEPGEEISAETILEAIDRAEIFNIEKTVDPKTGEATFIIEENCDDYYAVFLSRNQLVTLALELLAMTHPKVKTHNEPEFDRALEHEIETSPHAIGGGPIADKTGEEPRPKATSTPAHSAHEHLKKVYAKSKAAAPPVNYKKILADYAKWDQKKATK
jgi:hypothetical protein